MAYSDVVLADNPVGYWPLNETSGTVADNAEGTSSRDGTYVNTPTLNQAATGALGVCVSFNGSDERVLIGDDNVFSMSNANAFTLEAWINITAETNEHVIAKGGTSANTYEWTLRYDSDNHRFIWATMNSTGTEIYTRYGNGSKTTGTWYHVVATTAGAPGSTVPKLYVNGSEETAAGTGGSGGTYTNGTSGLWIAGHAAFPNYFNAKFCHVAIYNTALSSGTISAHYAAGLGSISVSADVADIDIAGYDTVPVDASVSADVVDVDFAADAPTVSADSNASISADVVDIAVEGFAASVTAGANLTIGVDPPNTINIEGYNVDISATLTADVVDIAVAGFAPTVTAESAISVSAPVADITIAGNTGWGNQKLRAYPAVNNGPGKAPQEINEAAANDASYHEFSNPSALAPDVDTYDGYWLQAHVGPNTAHPYNPSDFATIDDPIVNTGHVLRYRAYASGSYYPAVSIELWQHTYTAAEGNRFNSGDRALSTFVGTIVTHGTSQVALSGVPNTYEVAIPSSLVAGITDFNNLFLVFKRVGSLSHAGQTASKTRITWAEIEIPEEGITVSAQVNADVAGTINIVGPVPTIAITDNTGATVLAETADVTVAGVAPSAVSTEADVSFQAEVVDVIVEGPSPSVIIGDITAISADVADISVAGFTFSNTSTTQSITIAVEPGEVTTAASGPFIYLPPDAMSFKFISADYTGFTSDDAAPLNELSIGALLHGQTRVVGFRLGNTSSVATNMTLTIVSSNPGVTDMVRMSTDRTTWVPTHIFESVQPNAVTDIIWIQMTAAADAFVDDGTFLIEVAQSYA